MLTMLQAMAAYFTRVPAVSGFMTRLRSEDGQGMVEYGLILALIAVVVIAVVSALGGQLSHLFAQVCNTLSGNAGCNTTSS